MAAFVSILFGNQSAWALNTVTTIVGGGGLDGGPALVGYLDRPESLAVDGAGNLYISEPYAHRIRKVATDGTITTFAGGRLAALGDGGPAVDAGLSPAGIAVDALGNLYIADKENSRVRKVDLNGIITTVAGSGSPYAIGDNGPATAAAVGYPWDVAVDGSGNLYIAQCHHHRVRKVTPDGTITTVAGTGLSGFSGDTQAATLAQLRCPTRVAVDGVGNLYIVDRENRRVRRVGTDGIIDTVAGNGGFGPLVEGDATQTPLDVIDIHVDADGSLLIGTYGDRYIHWVTAGIISRVAGGGAQTVDGVPATDALLDPVWGLAADAERNIYLTGSHVVRKISFATGLIHTVAGAGGITHGGDGGEALNALVSDPADMVQDAAGNRYIAELGSHVVRKVAADGTITTVAGTGTPGYNGDGIQATSAQLNEPRGVALDSAGNLFIADSRNHRIRVVTPNGTIQTVAGNGVAGYEADGVPATSTPLNRPYDVLVNENDELLIADYLNRRVRRVDGHGTITTIAGDGTHASGGDGGPATQAQIFLPMSLARDDSGNLYIGTYLRVRRVDTAGTITTLAGGGSLGYDDDVPALEAALYQVADLDVDRAGNLFLAEHGLVRKLALDGRLYLIVGRVGGIYGDGVPSTDAIVYAPKAVLVDAAGNFEYGESTRVRRVAHATGLTASLSATSAPYGQTITASATVVGGESPTGSLMVEVDGVVACTAPLDGLSASCDLGLLSPGSYTWTGVYSGDRSHGTGIVSGSFTVTRAAQAPFTLAADTTALVWPGSTTLADSGGSGSGAVSYAVTAGAQVCELDGSTLTALAIGTCTVTATKSGDGNYLEATAAIEVTVGGATQAALSVRAEPEAISYRDTTTLVTSGGSGSGAVSYAVTAGAEVCRVDGATLTAIGVGHCTVAATKASDGRYAEATALLAVVVERAAQGITVGTLPEVIVAGERVELTATASSGLPVSFTSATPATCEVTATMLTGLASGTCTIVAEQAGDTRFQPASAVTRELAIVAAAVPLLGAWPLGGLAVGLMVWGAARLRRRP